MNILSSRITEAINSSDLKQAEIARRCGVSGQCFSNWKRIGQIRNDKLLILAKTLGTTVDWLLGDDIEEPPSTTPCSHLRPDPCSHLRPDCWCKSNA
jgi:transcriptional regulator with XRE-family HTH domain